jgi:hypothetical protein
VIDQNFRRRAAGYAEEYRRGIEHLAEKLRIDRAALSDAMNWAAMAYEGERCWAETEFESIAPDALDKQAKVIQLLYPRFNGLSTSAHPADWNFHRLVSALADPNRKAGWARQLSEEAAWPDKEEERDTRRTGSAGHPVGEH